MVQALAQRDRVNRERHAEDDRVPGASVTIANRIPIFRNDFFVPQRAHATKLIAPDANARRRQRVIGLLRQSGVTVNETTLSIQDFREADEIFSTGNMNKVMPIIAFDDRHFQFGPIARKARSLYWEWAHS